MKIIEYKTLKYVSANYQTVVRTYWPDLVVLIQDKLDSTVQEATLFISEALTTLNRKAIINTHGHRHEIV